MLDFVSRKESLMSAVRATAKAASRPTEAFAALLDRVLKGKRTMTVATGQKIFSQGDRADSIYFLQAGKVKISVVSSAGKEAVLALLKPQNFFGEGALVGQSLRMSSATALEPVTALRVEAKAMLRALHTRIELSETFIASLLKRNIDLEEDLCDQLFNHSEKRLARVLLKLARLREHAVALDATIPTLSHKILAEMVGTTRSRINFFMNKFRKMGLIEYNGHLVVRTELLTDVVLHD
jgi:CRP-like cAMP-binding protein